MALPKAKDPTRSHHISRQSIVRIDCSLLVDSPLCRPSKSATKPTARRQVIITLLKNGADPDLGKGRTGRVRIEETGLLPDKDAILKLMKRKNPHKAANVKPRSTGDG